VPPSTGLLNTLRRFKEHRWSTKGCEEHTCFKRSSPKCKGWFRVLDLFGSSIAFPYYWGFCDPVCQFDICVTPPNFRYSREKFCLFAVFRLLWSLHDSLEVRQGLGWHVFPRLRAVGSEIAAWEFSGLFHIPKASFYSNRPPGNIDMQAQFWSKNRLVNHFVHLV
jgi:hypothetical protein